MKSRALAAVAVSAVAVGLTLSFAGPAYAEANVDLAVVGQPAQGEVGKTVDVEFELFNQGPAEAAPSFTVVAPSGTAIVSDGSGAFQLGGFPANCLSNGSIAWTEATELECDFEGALSTGSSIAFKLSFLIESSPVGDDGTLTAVDRVGTDPEPTNDSAPIEILLQEIGADLAIDATSAEGEVGDIVDVVIRVTNNGPGSGGPGFEVVAPSGTVAVAAGEELEVGGCADADPASEDPSNWTEATNLVCSWESEALASGSADMTISFRIDKPEVGDNGAATVFDHDSLDPDLSNNVAPISISVTGTGGTGGEDSDELPVTGTQAGLIGAIGAGVLITGVGLYLVARRRREPAFDVRTEGSTTS